MGEFVRGAVTPSPLALAGTIVVSLSCLILCCTLITPDLLAHAGYGYIAKDDEDEYAYLTSTAWRVHLSPPAEFAVVVIGSSNTREAISNFRALGDEVGARIGEPVAAVDLTAGALRIWEAIDIAGAIRDKVHGVVVLPIAPLALSLGQDSARNLIAQPRMALTTDAYLDALKAFDIGHPRTTKNLFLDHYGYFLARPSAVFNVVTGPIEFKRHLAETWRSPTESERQWGIEQHQRNWKGIPANKDFNAAVYRWLIRYLKESPHLRIALLEATLNPATEAELLTSPALRELHVDYEKTVAALAAEEKVPYWDLSGEAQLSVEDFVDSAHVRNPEARARYTFALAEHVAALVQNKGAREESHR